MFKKLLYIIVLVLGFSSSAFTQYNLDIGFSIGGSGFLGDIGGTSVNAKKFIGDLIIKNTNVSAGGFVRNKLNKKWSVNSSINYIRLAGDDANSSLDGPRYWRNLRFVNNLFEIGSRGEFIFYRINDLGGTGRYNTALKLFAHAGLSLFYHSPRGSKNGYTWVNLKPLQTEGYSYSSIQYATPVGLGVVITHNRYNRYGLVINYRQTFTDYLDDVSTIFADPTNLSSDAAELANQYNGPENEALNFIAGQRRGNSSNKDVFLTVNFTYSKYFIRNNRHINKQSFRKTRSYYRNKKFKKRKSKVIRSKF